jgi:hypothetical protein
MKVGNHVDSLVHFSVKPYYVPERPIWMSRVGDEDPVHQLLLCPRRDMITNGEPRSRVYRPRSPSQQVPTTVQLLQQFLDGATCCRPLYGTSFETSESLGLLVVRGQVKVIIRMVLTHLVTPADTSTLVCKTPPIGRYLRYQPLIEYYHGERSEP